MSDLPITALQEMITLLYDRTKAGKVPWKVAFDSAKIQSDFGNNRIRLEQHFDSDIEDHYVDVVIINEEGQETDRIGPGTLGAMPTTHDGFTQYWQMMDRLFQMANRQARGADKTISDILSELKKRS